MKYIAVFFLAFYMNVKAQDPIFTNTTKSLVAFNPSFAGSNGGLRYQAINRNQWYNLSVSYLTFNNTVDAYLKPLRAGIALSYMRDDQARGTLVTDRIDLTYAQHLSFMDGKLKIIPSIQMGIFQKTLDRSKLTFGDQIDPRRGFVWSTSFIPDRYSVRRNMDFSSGLIVNYKRFYIGGTVFHITQPEEGVQGNSKLPYRLSVFASYNLSLGENVLLNMMSRFEKQQNFYTHQLNVNALFKKHVMVGLGLLSNNAVTTTIGYRHNYFNVSAGYDFVINKLSGSTAGSYEISAAFTLRNKEDRKLVTDFER